nr:MAG TPA: hypothetical protein [Bacteriophage sp.]
MKLELYISRIFRCRIRSLCYDLGCSLGTKYS